MAKAQSQAQFRIHNHERDFTIINNQIFRDRSLTLKAKGLLCTMLSLPEDWNYSVKGLCAITREGYDGIAATIRELENSGYVIRTQLRDESGRMAGTLYDVFEKPLHPDASLRDAGASGVATIAPTSEPNDTPAPTQAQAEDVPMPPASASVEVVPDTFDAPLTTVIEPTPQPTDTTGEDKFAALCAKSLRKVTVAAEDATRAAYNAAISRGYTPEQIIQAYDKYTARYRASNDTLRFVKSMDRWLTDADGLSWDAPRPALAPRKAKVKHAEERAGERLSGAALREHLCKVNPEYATLHAEWKRVRTEVSNMLATGADASERYALTTRERELESRLMHLEALYAAHGDAAAQMAV